MSRNQLLLSAIPAVVLLVFATIEFGPIVPILLFGTLAIAAMGYAVYAVLQQNNTSSATAVATPAKSVNKKKAQSSTRMWLEENSKERDGYISLVLLLGLMAAVLYGASEVLSWAGFFDTTPVLTEEGTEAPATLDDTLNQLTLQVLVGVLVGFVVLIVSFALVAPAVPAIRDNWMFDINEPKRAVLYTTAEPWQTLVRVRFGRFISFIRGWENPQFIWWNPWSWYKCYCWLFGLRVIGFPGLQGLLVYGIKRFKIHHKIVNQKGEEDSTGQKHLVVYEALEDKSNHVRTRPFTFPFVVSGAEIEKVPTSILGSVQARVIPYEEYKTFFNSDSWDTLLSEAIGSVIPGIVRGQLTLANVIGEVGKDLWGKDSAADKNIHDDVAKLILKALQGYKFKIKGVDPKTGKNYHQRTLAQLVSIEIMSVNITNFILEVSEAEEKQIRADILGRQKGRGRDLEGQGEGAAQGHILAKAVAAGEHGHTAIEAEAFRKAVTEGNGIDALVTSIVKSLVLPKKGD